MDLRSISLFPILFLSGAAGLAYEIVWTRMFSVGLGHEIVSVLAVVAAFFGGLALGSWALHASVKRTPNPGHWYAALEFVTGLWSLVLIPLIPWGLFSVIWLRVDVRCMAALAGLFLQTPSERLSPPCSSVFFCCLPSAQNRRCLSYL